MYNRDYEFNYANFLIIKSDGPDKAQEQASFLNTWKNLNLNTTSLIYYLLKWFF